ncbi:MAG TPA: MFS transporter [Acidimicrobiales bacterium]|nr:MFS transporter [Acidimicrobiales bacterium]
MTVTGALTYRSVAGRWALSATILGSAMAGIDATVVSIALPTIGRDFHAGVTELQWVSNAYLLALSGFLLLGGALGDRYGRRRWFQIGTAWFALASLLCGLAPDGLLLVAARGLQGVGSAMLTPGSLAILQASFAPNDRPRAIGAWSGLSGVATAVGPLLGGWLISAVSWRLIFLVNLPVALGVLLISARHVPESRDEQSTRGVDVPGAALFCLGLAGVAYGLTESPISGWTSAAVLGTLLGGVGMLLSFCLVERWSREPLLPLSIFRSLQFSGTNAVTLLVYGALGGSFFLLPTDLQTVLRFSPLAAGLSFLPVTLIMLIFSPRSGALAARIGPRLQMSVGPVVAGIGLGLLTRISTGGDYPRSVLPAAIVLAGGLAITVAPLTATVLAAAPSEHAGIASAVNNDVARAAALLAVAVLPALSGITGRSYLHPAALTHGFHQAMFIAGAACVGGGLLAVVTIRNPPKTAREVQPEQAADVLA